MGKIPTTSVLLSIRQNQNQRASLAPPMCHFHFDNHADIVMTDTYRIFIKTDKFYAHKCVLLDSNSIYSSPFPDLRVIHGKFFAFRSQKVNFFGGFCGKFSRASVATKWWILNMGSSSMSPRKRDSNIPIGCFVRRGIWTGYLIAPKGAIRPPVHMNASRL